MQKFIVVKGNGDPKQTKEVDDLLSCGWKIVTMQSQPVYEGRTVCNRKVDTTMGRFEDKYTFVLAD